MDEGTRSHQHSASYQHYVYIVQCKDGSLYTGYTQDLDARIKLHNTGRGGHYTKAHRPVKLIASWCLETKREALQVEYRIKQLSRQKKLELTESETLPEWLLDAKNPSA